MARIIPIKQVILVVCICLMLSGGACLADTVPITLADGGVKCAGNGVVVDGNSVTIAAPGEYEIVGVLTDGQIIVDCAYDDHITLILNNVSIHNESGAAIYIKESAARAYIVLADGSHNTLSGGEQYTLDANDEPNGVLFGKDDFTIQGGGALTVTANYMDGIVSKDDLCIQGGVIEIRAARNGIRGKDSVEILGGSIHIVAGNDGVKSTNESDPGKGYVTLENCALHIEYADEAIQVVSRLTISNCAIKAIKSDD